jgi:hypothetical protein
VTVTPLSAPADGADALAPPLPANPPQLLGGAGQFCGGGLICVAVSVSIDPKRTSALRPTSTVPWMGRTHANEEGLPE